MPQLQMVVNSFLGGDEVANYIGIAKQFVNKIVDLTRID